MDEIFKSEVRSALDRFFLESGQSFVGTLNRSLAMGKYLIEKGHLVVSTNGEVIDFSLSLVEEGIMTREEKCDAIFYTIRFSARDTLRAALWVLSPSSEDIADRRLRIIMIEFDF